MDSVHKIDLSAIKYNKRPCPNMHTICMVTVKVVNCGAGAIAQLERPK